MKTNSLSLDSRRVAFYDLQSEPEDFFAELVDGLGRPQKSLSPKFFYDARGSELFHRICELPEYYVTRRERALLESSASQIAECIFDSTLILEYGCGSSEKVRALLDASERYVAYAAIDISPTALMALMENLAPIYPELELIAICADFTRSVTWPLPADLPRMAFYPGSSIGNFYPVEARQFLAQIRRDLGAGACLLIGVDLKKDPALLHAAYNDVQGLTAAFNKNLLERIRRECGASIDLAAWEHRAFYQEELGRVEMHLVSLRDQEIRVGGRNFAFSRGETLHTENSYKYSVAQFQELAQEAGWRPERVWSDDWVSLHYLRA